MSGPTVIVSIVTWNHAGSIGACLESILGQTRKPDAIHVYDNASADKTISILERFQGVEVTRSDRNRGFCEGHNSIINSTRSDFVLLVNPDAILQPEYLEAALATMQQDRKIGAVCGLLMQGGDAVDSTGLLFTRNRRFLLRDHGRRRADAAGVAGEVFGCDGALPFFRRTMIEDISVEGCFFDSDFFAHKEDHDVAWRSRLLGWKSVFEPRCVAMHPRVFRPGDLELRRRLAPEIKYHAVKNDLLMLLKNEQTANFWRDWWRILPRRLAILIYTLFCEPRSLAAYGYVCRNWSSIWAKRRVIQGRSCAPALELRAWTR